MPAADAKISVIIPHLDDLDRLKSCVAALEQQSLPRERFEIIVADNGSKMDLGKLQSEVPMARIVRVAEPGAGPARNGGVAVSRHRILAFTDSDCVPDRCWLEAGLCALEQADLVGGTVTVSVPDPSHPTAAEAFEVVFAFDNRRYVEEKAFSVTANLFTTRGVFDAVGGFRTRVSEDLDWCWRARAMGYRIAYAEHARVSHPARRSWAELRRKWRRLTSEAAAFEQEAGSTPIQRILRPITVAFSPLVHAPRIIATDRLSVAAKLGALTVLFRLRLLRAWWLTLDMLIPEERRA
ncbi:MAG: glycosyltransferase [Hyphomicrobiaceae bacterium]